MLRRNIVMMCVAAFAATSSALAMPQAPIDAEAKWFAHLDMEQLKNSPMGQELQQLGQQQEIQRKLDAFNALFRFDPRQDLNSLTAYGYGVTEQDGAVIGRGNFDAGHLVTLVRANKDYQALDLGGHAVHSWVDDGEREAARKAGREPSRMYGSFIENHTLIISKEEQSLRNALDTVQGQRPSLQTGDWFAEQPQGNPFIVAGANLREIKHANPHAAMFKNAGRAVAYLTETGGQVEGSLALEGTDEAQAESLRKVAEGMVALLQLKRDKDPGEAEFARTVRVRQDGQRVTVTWSLPVGAIMQGIEKHTGAGQ